MTGAEWHASDDDIARIAAASHGDPFSVLGLHAAAGGAVIRVFVPGADRVEVLRPGKEGFELERRDADFFEGFLPGEVAAFLTAFALRMPAEHGNSPTPTPSAQCSAPSTIIFW